RWLFEWLDLAGPPRLLEPWFERAIEPQDYIPTFAGGGLHPVLLLPGRRRWTEVDIHRAVPVHQQSLGLATNAGELLVGLEHRAGLVAVEDHRPEFLDRNVGRQV